MKNFYVFCLFFLFASQIKAQCPDNNIILTSQDDIDNFTTTYPNCTQLKSNLRILSSFGAEVPIRSLSGISGITKVAGSISIENTELLNLQGLDNLVEIENTLHLSNNTALENLMGLAQLSVIGHDLSLFENPVLLNLTGLSNLTEVGRDFVLFGNTSLTSLAGMNQLTSIGGEFALVDNSSLQEVDVLRTLTTIGGSITFDGNTELSSLIGLNNISSFGGYIEMVNHPNLSLCANQFLCTFLQENGEAFFQNNAVGCSTPVEILEQCTANTNCSDKNLTLEIIEDHRCASTPLTFTSNAENSRYLWDFGDGQTIDTEESNQAQQTYMATGEYTVTLITIDDQDCRDTISQLISITAPVTDFTYTVAGNSISVVADTSNAPFINNYLWRFGDGATASSLLPTTIYTYRNPGTYTVTLQTDGGCSLPITKAIEIGGNATPENTIFTCLDGLDNDGDSLIDGKDPDCDCVLAEEAVGCCDGFGIEVITTPDKDNQSIGAILLQPFGGSTNHEEYSISPPIEYTTSPDGISIENLSAGTYRFLVSDQTSNCRDSVIAIIDNIDCNNFSVTISQEEGGCFQKHTAILKGGIAPYQYNWTADGQHKEETFIGTNDYLGTQQLMVTDGNGCTDTVIFIVRPTDTLSAKFTYTITPDSILLVNQSVGNYNNFQWTSNIANPVNNDAIQLPPPDSYEVCLIIRNECELENSMCQTIVVEGPPTLECPTNLLLERQSQVDSFPILYPNCTSIEGNVFIRNNSDKELTNLDGLFQLTSIGGDLEIADAPNGPFNQALTSIKGLSNIHMVGGNLLIRITSEELQSLEGLNNITSVGGLQVTALGNINSLSVFNSLEIINGDVLLHNLFDLPTLAGLENVTTINGKLELFFTEALRDISPLSNITTLNGGLTIHGQRQLTDLSPLSNLTSINGPLSVNLTGNLANLIGLENIDPTSITRLELLQNGVLEFCNLPNICRYLAEEIGPAFLSGNPEGCLSTDQLQASCSPSPSMPPSIFIEYPWLSDHVDYTDCGAASITEFESLGYIYLLIETESSSIMYNADGVRYCQNTSTYDCHTYYTIDKVLQTWNCNTLPVDMDNDGILSDTDADDNDPCNPNPLSITCVRPPTVDTPAIFSNYPFLFDLVDFTDCSEEKLTAYLSGGYPYVYIEGTTSSILYNGRGFRYCTNGGGLNCLESYRVDEILEEWECVPPIPVDQDQDGILSDTDPDDTNPCVPDNTVANCEGEPEEPKEPSFLSDYPFLANLVDFEDCDGTKVMLYRSSGYPYLYVETTTSSVLYNGNGVTYCTTGPGFICTDFYPIDEAIEDWTCIGNTSPTSSDCTAYEGTIFLDNCNDGSIFFLIRLVDGTVVDPYFAEGIEFDYYDGQAVNFDYSLADFDSPCREGLSAVTVTCIEEAPTESQDNSIFEDYPFLSDFVDISDCADTKITAYLSNGYPYIYVESPNSSILYNGTGLRYCTSGRGLNCLESYAVDEILKEWVCNQEDTKGDCSKNSGTIVLENCDDGTPFFFVRLADGTLLDVYFAANVDFELANGQEVNFDYTLANFSSPCSIAAQAITVTCIELANTPPVIDNSIFNDYPFLTALVDPLNCDDEKITAYLSGGYPYVYVETANSSILYNGNGATYCTTAPNFDCLLFYPADEMLKEWVCADTTPSVDNDQDGYPSTEDSDDNNPCIPDPNALACGTTEQNNQLFEDYPFLNDLVDPDACTKDSIIVYTSAGNATYIYVIKPSGSILYNKAGSTYCTSGPNYNCLEFYTVNTILDTWSCGNTTLSLPQNQDMNGTFSDTDPTIRFASPRAKTSVLDFTIYPNPTDGPFVIELPVALKQTTAIHISDLQGRLLEKRIVDTSDSRQISIHLSAKESGIYFVQIITENKVYTKRLIIE